MNCLVNYSDSSDEEQYQTCLLTSRERVEGGEECAGESESTVVVVTTASKNKIAVTHHDDNNDSIGNHRNVVEGNFRANQPLNPNTDKPTAKRHSELSLSEPQEDPENVEPAQKKKKPEPCSWSVLPSTDDTLAFNSTNRKKTDQDVAKKQLALPSTIQSMFCRHGDHRQWKDDPSRHGNRIRSFPHVEGNWATHVFIPVRQDKRLIHFVHGLIRLFSPIPLEILDEFHVSLSRTVSIRHHWIQPLVDSLKAGLATLNSCVGDFEDIRFYSNDEKTRSFMCIEVSKEDTCFTDYVSVVDECFQGFKLPKYYQDPSFHISVAWCLGDVTHSVSSETLNKAKKLLSSFCETNPELSVLFAQTIHCQTGNKSFVIPLAV